MKASFEQRLLFIESTVGQLIRQGNDAIERANGLHDTLMCVVGALVEKGLIAEDDIKHQADVRHLAKEQAKDRRNAEWIANEVKEGKLAAAETVADDSIIVGTEFDAEQRPVVPGYIRSHISAFESKLQEGLRGAKIGDSVSLEDGHTFKLLEIYQPATPPAKISEEKAND